MTIDDAGTSGVEHSEDEYTVGEQAVHVEGDTGRPEVFVQVRPEDLGASDGVTLMRDSDALELYRQLGEYLESEGYDSSDEHADGMSRSGSGIGWDRSAVDGLVDEALRWMGRADGPTRDPADELWAFSLATFVDGTAISPMGFDETDRFDVGPELCADGSGEDMGLAEGLREHCEEETPDDKNWCPNCEEYAEFEVLDTVRRHEFGVQNELRGCPDCRYVFVPATEWEEMPESHQKGDRHERQGRRILNRKYRANRVPSNYGNNDPFHLADLMGLQGGLPFALVQIKTNRFTAEDRRYYRRWAGNKVDGEHTIFEVWVRVDRDGWRMHRFNPKTGEFTLYYETATCDPTEVRDEWGDVFEKSLPAGAGAEASGKQTTGGDR